MLVPCRICQGANSGEKRVLIVRQNHVDRNVQYGFVVWHDKDDLGSSASGYHADYAAETIHVVYSMFYQRPYLYTTKLNELNNRQKINLKAYCG